MGNLSTHFSRREFACRCGCGYDAVDLALVSVLEDVRTQFVRPVIVNSGCRCREYNQKVGGAIQSWHLYCKAADIRVVGVLAHYVADYLEDVYRDELGIGRYERWTHVDVGPRRRWREPYLVVTDT